MLHFEKKQHFNHDEFLAILLFASCYFLVSASRKMHDYYSGFCFLILLFFETIERDVYLQKILQFSIGVLCFWPSWKVQVNARIYVKKSENPKSRNLNPIFQNKLLEIFAILSIQRQLRPFPAYLVSALWI